MKPVLHVIPSVALRDGGPSRAVAGMSQALEARGVRSEVATTDADGAGHLDVPLGEPVTYGGMHVRVFRCQLSEKFKYSAPLGRWLRGHVADYAVVHVHAVFSYAPIAAGAACRRSGVPYVVRPLGTIDPWSLTHRAALKRTLLHFGVQSLLAGAARIHYTSDEERHRAQQSLPGLPPGAVIPLGIDDEMFSDAETSHRASDAPIVSVSRLDPKKGIDLLIDAFHESCERYPSRRLIVAGDGDPEYVRELRAAAERGRGADRITFSGWVAGNTRRNLLGTARVLVLPSAQENFGLSIVEAMAAGTPVIVADTVDLAAQIASAGAGWVVDRSVQGVRRALELCLADEGEANLRGQRARGFAEQFRWRAVASRLVGLYEDVASSPVTSSAREIGSPARVAGRF